MSISGRPRDEGSTSRDWVEIRLLGPLRVRLADGAQVHDRDWRTGKNADLLRWLALHAGSPVPVETLSDGLWPDADETRARSSLRTAVAQLRRVLGADTVERVADGLVLTGCWVDALAFRQLAEDADRHRRAGRHADTYAAALEAELQPAPAPPVTPAFIGRVSELAWLDELLGTFVSERPDVAAVVALTGSVGSGRRRLATEAGRRRGLTAVVARQGQPLDAATTGAADRLLLWRPDPVRDLEQIAALVTGRDTVRGPAAVVLLLPCPGDVPALDELLRDEPVRSLELQPLLLDDVDALAGQVLAGPPLPSLLEELYRVSGGLPGQVLSVLRQWASTGRLVATSRGLAVAPRPSDHDGDRSGRRTLAQALPRLDRHALEALQLAALFEQAVTPTLLAPLLRVDDDGRDDDGAQRARARAALEQLVDVSILRSSAAGAVWRHPLLQDAVRAWMRPAVAQRLHRRIAGQAPMPSAAPPRHAPWPRGGPR